MKDEEVKVGSRVLIPKQKTAGKLGLDLFMIHLNAMVSNTSDHLYVIYKSKDYFGQKPEYSLGLTAESGTDESVNGYCIGNFNFYAEDLECYDLVEKVSAINAGLVSPTEPYSASNKDENPTPELVNSTDLIRNLEEEIDSLKDVPYNEMTKEQVGRLEKLIREHNYRDNRRIADTTPLEGKDDVNETFILGIDPKDLTPDLIVESKKEGLRYNEGKLDYTLMDLTAFSPMIEVLEFGAKKYSRDNWKIGGENFSLLKLLGSTMRHLANLLTGELYDQESGLSHIGHLQCNLMFIGYFWNKHLKTKKSKQKSKFLKDLPNQK